MAKFRIYTGTWSSSTDKIDIVNYIEELKWSWNDLDSPSSGRDLTGDMHRGLVTSKLRCDVKLLPVTTAVAESIMTVIKNQYFKFSTDLVPGLPSSTILNMYNSVRSGGIAIVTTDNVVKHKDMSFNIIQR